MLIAIDGYWNDDKSEFSNYLVKETDDVEEENDDEIFFYGLSLNYIKDNLNNENTGMDFTITNYYVL
jgi:hypothetical protein